MEGSATRHIVEQRKLAKVIAVLEDTQAALDARIVTAADSHRAADDDIELIPGVALLNNQPVLGYVLGDEALGQFDGIDCLLTNAELVAHFRAVAANLQPHGVYVVELTHPRDCSQWDYGKFVYKGERDGCSVVIDWATNDPVADPLTQVVDVEVVMHVRESDGTEYDFQDRARERFVGSQELIALGDLSGLLHIVGWYGDFRVDQPFDNTPEARRMIVVLERSEHEDALRASSFVSPRLRVGRSPKHGYGLFAQEPIAAGEVLVVWSGAVLGTDELLGLDAERRGRALQVEEDLHLLAEPEQADYVNHSCDPNAGLSGQVALKALRAISVGEEVCYDYAMSEGSLRCGPRVRLSVWCRRLQRSHHVQ